MIFGNSTSLKDRACTGRLCLVAAYDITADAYRIL